MTHLVNHQLSSAKIHSQEQLVLAVSSCPLAQKHAQRAQHQANGLWLAASEANLHKKTLDKVEKFIAGRIKKAVMIPYYYYPTKTTPHHPTRKGDNIDTSCIKKLHACCFFPGFTNISTG
jgi:hypothetical protein